MTKDDNIKMAEEAGFSLTHSGMVQLWLANKKDIETFAKLVAAKERESLADLCETWFDPMWDEQNKAAQELASAIRARS